MTDKKRPYRKKRRAEQEAETRLRITESAVELHGTLGPSRTSMSAIADAAGVPRSTLYRHFPDEAANPSPDLAAWAEIEDPDERLRAALTELYDYYRGTESMMENLLRDEALMPVVQHSFSRFHAYLAQARDVLLQGRDLRGNARRRVRAATGHALDFRTWRSLARDGDLADREAAELMCRLVAGA